MKVARFHQYGGPEVMGIEELEDPVPGRDEVVVRVGACALNHVDLDIRDGTSRLPVILPHTLGLEFAGEICAVGADVTAFAVGDRVTALHQVHCGTCRWCAMGEEQNCERPELFGVHRPGGYATHVRVPQRALIRIPESLSYEDAAASQTTFSTAWHALHRASLTPGETLLVNAVGSGVGAAGIQVGRLLGARVIASAGSDQKLSAAEARGVIAGINYNRESLADGVRRVTEGSGVDVVLESVGGRVLEESIDALAQDGRVVTVGAHAGEVVKVDAITLFRRQLSLLGSVRATASEIRHVIDLVAAGVFEPIIAATFPLEEAGRAQETLSGRTHFGKIVLLPN